MSVLAISIPVTNGGDKIVKMLYIYYLVWFQKNQE